MKRRLCVLLAMSLMMTSAGGPTVYGYEEAAISAIVQEDAAVSAVREPEIEEGLDEAAADGVVTDEVEIDPYDEAQSDAVVPRDMVSQLDGEAELEEADPSDTIDMNCAPKALCFQGDRVFALANDADSVAYRKSGELGRDKMSQQQIIALYNSIPKMSGSSPNRFASVPSAKSPYSEGKLSQEYLNAAGAYLNYIRNLSGLRNTKLDDSLNAAAQKAALVNAANGSISHSPSQPSGMSSSLYKAGAAAASSSNLYKHPNMASSLLLRTSLISYMDDNNSASNLACLGHRRWVLFPNLAYTGFGQAEKGTLAIGAMKDFKSSYDSVNPSGSTSINYDFISWPSSGNFPILKTNLQRNAETLLWKEVPWSVSLNPKKYKTPSASSLTITVTRQSDGKVWKFTKSDVNNSPTSKTQKYMMVNTENYGVSNCIIFNLGSEFTDTDYNRRAAAPDEKEQMFSVCISGLKTASGASTQLNYRVNFFDLTNPDTSSPYYDSAAAFEETDDTLPPELNPVDESTPVDLIQTEVKASHTVRLVSGSSEMKNVTVEDGDLLCDVMKDLAIPSPSTAGLSEADYGFAGWYSGGDASGLSSGGCLVEGSSAVSGDVTAYAFFKKREPGAVPVAFDSAETVLNITPMKSVAYDGTYQTPDVTLKIGKTVLCRGEDYLLSYRNNKDVGTATVTIIGIGAYSGTRTTTFRITPRAISNAEIWFEDVNGVSSITSVNDDRIRGHFVDFDGPLGADEYSIDSLVCTPNAQGAKVTVIVSGKAPKYQGLVKCTFNCYRAGAGVQLISNGSDSGFVKKMKLDTTSEYDETRKCYVYTGSAIKPTITIPGLTYKTDYTLKYRNNKNVGLASVIISGKGAYKGTYRLYFSIGKRDIGTGSVAPIATKVYKGSAQRVKPKVTVYASSKLLKPKIKKDYSVMYSDAINAGTCSVTVQGMKNYMGTITTEMVIAPAPVSKMKISGLQGMVTDDGFVLTGTPVASFAKIKNLVRGYDYELGEPEFDVTTGKAFVEVRGLRNFTNAIYKPVKVLIK